MKPELQKTASVGKTAEIKKQIIAVSNPGAVEKLRLALSQVKQALDATATPIPREVFGESSTIGQCITSMALLGVVPTSDEAKLLVDMFAGKDEPSPNIESGPGQISIAILRRLLPFAESRSFFRPQLLQRVQSLPTTKQASVESTSVALGEGISKGVMAAMHALFGLTAGTAKAVGETIPGNMATLIAKHPVIAGIMAAMLMNKISPRRVIPTKPIADGNFTVADPTQGLYNNDWQRRFIDMQNRPVTVIKTGAALQQAELLVSPLTYLIMTSDLVKESAEQRLWDKIADQYLTHLQSEQFQGIIKSASAVAPGEDLSLVVPEIGDFNILKKILSF